MKLKRILKFAIFAASAGLIFGLVQAVQVISSHQYLGYGLYRLTFHELARRANNGVFYALILGIFLFLVSKLFSLFWRKLLSPFFEVRIIRKDKLAPLFNGSILLAVFAYLVFQIIKFIQSPNHKTSYFLGQSLVVFLAFYLISQYEKINRQLQKFGILSFLKSSGTKIWWGTVLFVFCGINVLSLSQKLFFRPPGPNVLLIVADALRPDHLGCYGYERPTSPHIDKFAADALVFENAFSNASWTLPSMGTVFTSLYPHQHHALYWTDSLHDKHLTLAEVFRNNNFMTLSIQANSCLTKDFNFNQGFQYFNELLFEDANKIVDHFNKWLNKVKKKSFFAYLHFMDTHLHYNPPEDFKIIFEPEHLDSQLTGIHDAFVIRALGKNGLKNEDKNHLINLYDAEIRYFDYNFELIIEILKKQGILDKTIIILTADHGEEFWDHDDFEHGHSLYNEVLHVPLIFKHSSKLPAKRIDNYVQLLDLFPTVLRLTGIKNKFYLEGTDLISFIFSNKKANREIFSEGITYGPEKKAVLINGWKLIVNSDQKSEKSIDPLGGLIKNNIPHHKIGFELYDIKKDYVEKNNLIEKYPQIANKLKEALVSFCTNEAGASLEKNKKLNEKLEAFRSLGYIR